MNLSAEYDLDFHAWILKNVELLRNGQLTEVDAEHIAEELESMGKRDLRQLRSRLQVLIMHLLKWQHQPQGQNKVGYQPLTISATKSKHYCLIASASEGN